MFALLCVSTTCYNQYLTNGCVKCVSRNNSTNYKYCNNTFSCMSNNECKSNLTTPACPITTHSYKYLYISVLVFVVILTAFFSTKIEYSTTNELLLTTKP